MVVEPEAVATRFGDSTGAAGVVLAQQRHRLGDLPDLGSLRCEVRVDERLVHEATGAAIGGAPLQSLALLSQHLRRRGQILPAVSLVLAGALTDATPLLAGHQYDLSIERLGRLSIAT
jgi:2-oxo-3-hexenedioate decarboxylase